MKRYLKIYYKEATLLLYILVVSLYSIKKAHLLNSNYNNYIYKELLWISIGITLYVIVYKIKFRYIFKLRYILYFGNILLLIYVLLYSKNINGTKGWIDIGFISIQPSEFIKITYPLISIYLVRNKKYILNTLYFLIPSVLILLEPDTGNFIILFIIYLFIIFNKKSKKKFYFFYIILFLSILSSVIIFYFKPSIYIKLFNGKLYYRYKRILNIDNLQINNALISISRTNMFPYKHNKIPIYIPEGTTDFIFSFTSPNIGYIFLILLLFSYYYLIYLFIKRYNIKRYYYQKKLIGTFISIFSIQVTYNILMNLGLVPIMGIPLPFLSYGGSNIISYFILISLSTKKISPILDKDNNNYKSNYHMDLVDKMYKDMAG